MWMLLDSTKCIVSQNRTLLTSCYQIPTSVEKWPRSAKIRASVNNFGYGGSNAHAIIEHPDYLLPYYQARLEVPKPSQVDKSVRQRILRVGAKDQASALARLANIQSYVERHESNPDDDERLLDQLVYTFGQKRSEFPWSTAFSVSSVNDFVDAGAQKPQRASRPPRIGYVFSGQGAQWHAMGRELMASYPAYYDALEEADNHLQMLGADWSLVGKYQERAWAVREDPNTDGRCWHEEKSRNAQYHKR